MSIDSSASIGYGFEVPEALLKSVDDIEDLIDQEGLEFMFGGDSYADDNSVFLVLSKSHVNVYIWEGGSTKINPKKMIVDKDWDARLKVWAKTHKLPKPKIGWWLTCSVA